MTPERWQQVEDLCHATLECAPEAGAAFLAHACAGDDLLRRQVESFVAHERDAPAFMSVPAVALAEPNVFDSAIGTLLGRPLGGCPGCPAGRRLGGYAIRSLLGVGGMGEVYRAYDDTLGREVAIKVLPPQFTADPARRGGGGARG